MAGREDGIPGVGQDASAEVMKREECLATLGQPDTKEKGGRCQRKLGYVAR